MQLAFNSGQHSKEVVIFNPVTKEKASVFLQASARVKLPSGFSVDSQFQRENPEITSTDLEVFRKEAKRLSDPNSYFKAPSAAAIVEPPAPAQPKKGT